MRKLLFTLITIFCFSYLSNGQNKKDTTYPKLLTKHAFNVFINKAMSNVASGQEKGTSLANHAAFDPSKGSFLLNGFVPMFYKGDTARNLSFVNFKITGGLIDDNATALFEDKKLNSGVDVDLKYNFSVGWKGITYLRNERLRLETDLESIKGRKRADSARLDIIYSTTVLDYKINLLQHDSIILRANRDSLVNLIPTIQTKAQNFSTGANKNVDSLKVYAKAEDSLLNLLDKVNKDIYESDAKKDSFSLVRKSQNNLLKQQRKDLNTTYEKKLLDVQLNATITSMHFGWFAIGIGFNKKSYYTFTDTATFDNQISKRQQDAINGSIEYHYYHQQFDRPGITYFNIGLKKRRYNNIEDLSTITLDQEKKYTNGNTERVVKKSYSAYTVPVEEFRSVLLYGNLYRFIGKKTGLGIHIFPDIDFRSTKKRPVSLGLGGIVGIKDEKKDKSILNIEAYTKFRDISNSLDSEDKFYQRLQIGIRVGLPINLYSKN